MHVRTDGSVEGAEGPVYERMDCWTVGWMDGLLDGRSGGLMANVSMERLMDGLSGRIEAWMDGCADVRLEDLLVGS